MIVVKQTPTRRRIPITAWQYITQNQEKYFSLLHQHIIITLVALLICMAVGLLLAGLCYRSALGANMVGGMVSALRVVPSIALLLLCMPVLGTGPPVAIFALTLLGLPAVLNSSITALQSVDPKLIEAAEACGMGRRRLFWKVRWPLALPGMLTGCRMAGLSVAAGATLAAYIGAGGLGELILSGISQYRFDMVFAGGLSMIGVSLCIEGIFQLAHVYIQRHKRRV